MNVLITGMNGTVAPVFAARLQEAGRHVLAWDRSRVPVDRWEAVRDFVIETDPAWCVHMAMGSPDWAEMLARVCAERQIQFLFTSSVSVFSNSQQGPFSIGTPPKPQDDYGRYKLECEQRVRAANAKANIVRLGWQIGASAGSNNMIDFLERTHRADGRIEVGRSWFPACSFLQDTAISLDRMMRNAAGELYHLDGNPGLSLYEIATRLNAIHGSPWRVVAAEEPVWNTRMLDPRMETPSITARLDPTNDT